MNRETLTEIYSILRGNQDELRPNFRYNFTKELRKVAHRHVPTDRLERRAELAKVVETFQEDGYIALIIDSTDCDQFRVRSGEIMRASVFALEHLIDRTLANAEGPTFIDIVGPSDLRDWSPSFQDIAAEQMGY